MPLDHYTENLNKMEKTSHMLVSPRPLVSIEMGRQQPPSHQNWFNAIVSVP